MTSSYSTLSASFDPELKVYRLSKSELFYQRDILHIYKKILTIFLQRFPSFIIIQDCLYNLQCLKACSSTKLPHTGNIVSLTVDFKVKGKSSRPSFRLSYPAHPACSTALVTTSTGPSHVPDTTPCFVIRMDVHPLH